MGLKWLVFLIGLLDLIGIYVVQWGSTSKYKKDTCLKEIGLCLQIIITNLHSMNEHNWEDLCIQLRNQQTCTSMITKSSEVPSGFCLCLIVNLLTEHEFCYVYLIGYKMGSSLAMVYTTTNPSLMDNFNMINTFCLGISLKVKFIGQLQTLA